MKIECKEGPLGGIFIHIKVSSPNFKGKWLKAMIDTGCTQTIIDESLYNDYKGSTPSNPISSTLASGQEIMINKVVKGLTYSITDECDRETPKLHLGTALYYHVLHLGAHMILGLSTLIHENMGFTLTKNTISLYPIQITTPIISEFALEKRGGCSCEKFSDCTKNFTNNIALIPINEEISKENPNIALIPKSLLMINIAKLKPEIGRNPNHSLQDIIKRLSAKGLIGEIPNKFWSLDSPECKLELINPGYIIKGKGPKMPSSYNEFKMHTDELLKIGAIRTSSSPHNSPAMIVMKHSEIKRGKSRMVINYKWLNDNTVLWNYRLPDSTILINSISEAKVFSKMDCKSGFYQIRMHKDSIPWTAFQCENIDLFEWLVMPFGLKNAPATFQHRMDQIFSPLREFCLVYVDDILIFSKDHNSHRYHLIRVLNELEKHGIVISPKKLEMEKPQIEFLGSIISQGAIKLQPHIATKIIDYPETFENLTAIRSFLGLVNQARNYIPNLSKILGPLHNKTSLKGQRKFTSEDIKIVKQIKSICKNLPQLALPQKNEYLIVQTDGSLDGWGAILSKRPNMYSSQNEESICRYSSGKFKEKGTISSIDAELLAIGYGIKSFLFLLVSRETFTIRTDCEAIVKFWKKKGTSTSANKRWVNFMLLLNEYSFNPQIEHIKGKDNSIADALSRVKELKNIIGHERSPGTKKPTSFNIMQHFSYKFAEEETEQLD